MDKLSEYIEQMADHVEVSSADRSERPQVGRKGSGPMNAALECANRQRHYDRLHHLMRIRDFEAAGKLDHFDFGLLQQSRRCVASPAEAYNSVDLDDAGYLAELDAFANAANRKLRHIAPL